jgi:hypothetical protein
MEHQDSLRKPPSKEKKYVSDYNRNNYQNKKIEISKKRKKYYLENKKAILESHREYKKEQYENNPTYKLRSLVTRAIGYAIKKHNLSVTKYLPYSFDELRNHLEFQFESWMNWENHGVYDPKIWNDNNRSTWTWNVDHIIPQSDLSYKSMEEDNFRKCWALENLRPLSAKQNFLDGIHRIRHGVING